jgi:zinc protease
MTRTFRALVVAIAVAAMQSGAAAQVGQWPSERPPRPTAPRPVKFPPYEVRTLPNGLQVIAVSHHEQPAVTVRLIVRAGSTQDPADKPGVASLAATLLDQGTTSMNAEKIANSIDSIGGAMGTGSGSDLTFINAAVMKDSLNVGLDLVSDLARNPAFAPEEIERQRQQMLSALKVSYEDPEYLAGAVFERLVYGFNPYGKPDAGTPASIAAITRDDLVAFHKRWFGANNAILAIVGDVTAQDAFAGAERAFGTWGRVEVSADKPVDPPPPTRRVIVVDRPGSVQTEIRVGNLALPRRHPDFLALDLASKILGGEGGNRLHRVLRSERGLTYGAAANMVALKNSGHLVADTDTRSGSTAEVLRLIVDEIARLQRQRVSTRELEDAQAYLTGSFPLTIETPGAIALQVLNAVFYGLDLEELETYRDRVNAITPDDIQRVARLYLHPDRLSIVLVGDAAAFASQLAGVGFDQVERIPAGEVDLSSVTLRNTRAERGRLEAAAFRPFAGVRRRRDPAGPDGQDVPALVARAVEAKGGAALLETIRTIQATATHTLLDAPGGPVVFEATTSIRYPGAFRVDARMPAGPLVQVFNAGEAWVQDQARGVRAAPAAFAEELEASVQRDAILMLLGLSRGQLTASPAAGEASLEVQARGMRPVIVEFDPATALIATLRYRATGPGAARMQEAFSDYRDVRGLKVAHKTVVSRDGVPVLERVVRAFDYNVPLDPALFTRPS